MLLGNAIKTPTDSIVDEPINFTLRFFFKVHKEGKSDLSTTICASGLIPEFWVKAHLWMKKCIGSSLT